MLNRLLLTAVLASLAFAAQADDDDRPRGPRYEVTITNITKGQTFTPLLVATHSSKIAFFELGEPASVGLEILAEDGATGTLAEELAATGEVADAVTIDGLLGPGQRTSTVVRAAPGARRLSVAAMLIPTNDTFVALDSVRLPFFGSIKRQAIAYDAGTEANDQNCNNMPGPRCGGTGFVPGPSVGDEGYVYVSNGFHTLPPADDGEVLGPLTYDWRNPVALIEVRRLR